MAPSTSVRVFMKTEIFFPLYLKKSASIRSVFESYLPVHTNTRKRFENASFPYRACALSSITSLWRHRIRKPPFSPAHTCTVSRRFQNSPVWTSVSGRDLSLLFDIIGGFNRSFSAVADFAKVNVFKIFNRCWVVRSNKRHKPLDNHFSFV